MRKPEQLMWQYLARQMSGQFHMTRHEDRHSPDIPDLSFAIRGVDGWIELKTLPSWPKRETTPVKIPHLYPGQINFMEQRGKNGGGRVWLLLAVGKDMAAADWILVPWFNVRHLKEGRFTQSDLIENFMSFSSKGLRPHLAGRLIELPAT